MASGRNEIGVFTAGQFNPGRRLEAEGRIDRGRVDETYRRRIRRVKRADQIEFRRRRPTAGDVQLGAQTVIYLKRRPLVKRYVHRLGVVDDHGVSLSIR